MRALVLLVALFMPLIAFAETARTPMFFALSVPDIEKSIAWYRDYLDMKVTRLPGNDVAKAALLQGDGIVVEVIQHSQAFDAAKRVPELEKRYLGYGMFKVGFYVDDLDATVERLRKRGAEFRGRVYEDSVLGVRSTLVLDNNGNLIQLFQPISKR